MAINKKLIHCETREQFNIKNTAGEFLNSSVVFIKSTGELWTHGKFFGGAFSGATADKVTINLGGSTYDVSRYGHNHSDYFQVRALQTIAAGYPTMTELTGLPKVSGNAIVGFTGASGHLIQFYCGLSSTAYVQMYSTYGGSMMWRNSTNEVLTSKPWKTLLDSANYDSIIQTMFVKKAGDTMTGNLTAPSFIKTGGTASQHLRADGGVATFNWTGQSDQPMWLWGGNTQNTYYLYNPTNFRVANADTVDDYHATSFVGAVNYFNQSSSNTGWYKIKIKSAASWMYFFKIRMYQSYQSFDIDVSGYNYGVNHWLSPVARLVSSSQATMPFKFGYDSDWNLWVAVPVGQYTGISVLDCVNGHVQAAPHDRFEIILQPELTGTIQSELTLSRGAYLNDNVASATKLQTPRAINGTNFDGTAPITTATWGTTRTFTFGTDCSGLVNVNGSANVTFPLVVNTATQLRNSRSLWGNSFNGTTDVNGTIKAANGITLPYVASSWLSMATRNNVITGDVSTSVNSAHSLYKLTNSTGDVIAFGGLGVNIGFYGFTKALIDAGTNASSWSTSWNVNTGALISTSTITSTGFYKSGSSNSYALLGAGGHQLVSQGGDGNSIVARLANGYIRTTYFESVITDENPTIGSVYIRNTTDNLIRRMSFSKFMDSVKYAASGTWGISIDGSSNGLWCNDTRGITTTPSTTDSGLWADFKYGTDVNLVGMHTGVLTFRPYPNFSGGPTYQLGFTDTNNLWLRSGSNTTWGAWSQILSTTNYTSILDARYLTSHSYRPIEVRNAGNVLLGSLSSSNAEALILKAGANMTLTYSGGNIVTFATSGTANNYLTGVSGSGDGSVVFTRQGLSDIIWNSKHEHHSVGLWDVASDGPGYCFSAGSDGIHADMAIAYRDSYSKEVFRFYNELGSHDIGYNSVDTNSVNASGYLLSTGNYTQYTVSKTGVGASGNWDINAAALLTKPVINGTSYDFTVKGITDSSKGIGIQASFSGIGRGYALLLEDSVFSNANLVVHEILGNGTLGQSKKLAFADNIVVKSIYPFYYDNLLTAMSNIVDSAFNAVSSGFESGLHFKFSNTSAAGIVFDGPEETTTATSTVPPSIYHDYYKGTEYFSHKIFTSGNCNNLLTNWSANRISCHTINATSFDGVTIYASGSPGIQATSSNGGSGISAFVYAGSTDNTIAITANVTTGCGIAGYTNSVAKYTTGEIVANADPSGCGVFGKNSVTLPSRPAIGVKGYSENGAGVVGISNSDYSDYHYGASYGVIGYNSSSPRNNNVLHCIGVLGQASVGTGGIGVRGRGRVGVRGESNFDNLSGNESVGIYGRSYNGRNDRTAIWAVGSAGGTTDWINMSDRRLKYNIIPLAIQEDRLENVSKIPLVSFQWISDGTQAYGAIAQEVATYFPELVMKSPMNEMLSLNTTALQSLKIAYLEDKCKKLEDRIVQLETIVAATGTDYNLDKRLQSIEARLGPIRQ